MKFWGLVLIGTMGWVGLLHAENEGVNIGNPSDLWYRGFLMTKSAEELREKGELFAAYNKLDEAFEVFKSLSLNHPDFQTPIVKRRLHLTAVERHGLKRELKNHGITNGTKKSEIEALRERSRILQKELEELKSKIESHDVPDEKLKLSRKDKELAESGDKRTGILEDLVRKLDFQERLTEEEKRLFSAPSAFPHLFPEDSHTVEDENGTEITIERKRETTNAIPDNWIPRPFEGRMTYIVPLIETTETRAFTKLQTVPAILRSERASGK